jgi:hypothetical protein
MLRLAIAGWQPKDIAIELGVTPQTVSNVLNSALSQKLLGEMRAAANKEAITTAQRLEAMNAKAIDTLQEILDDADAPRSLRAKVAMDNLDRTGFGKQINIRGSFSHAHFDAEGVERIKLMALEAAQRKGCLVLEDQRAEGTSRSTQNAGSVVDVGSPVRPSGPLKRTQDEGEIVDVALTVVDAAMAESSCGSQSR